jgi:hypothetical protein
MNVLSSFTDGLASNLVAEFVGLLAGIVVTYFIVDRVVSARLKAHNKPLLRRLRDRIEYAVAMMAYSWSVVLGVARAEDAPVASRGSFVSPIEELLCAPSASAQSILAQLRAASSDAPLLIATLTVENVTRISSLAERLASIVATDLALQEQLADLDSIIGDLELSVRHWARIEESAVRESEAAIVEAARDVFRKVLALRAYADANL